MHTAFSIFRIVGNSLPPRHSAQNNIRSVKYILQHEPRFAECRRFWILNKITDMKEKDALRSILEGNGETVIDLPFDPQRHFDSFLDATGLPEAQKQIIPNSELHFNDPRLNPLLHEWVLRHKSQSLVGINAARNHALGIGRGISDWTLVLDGGVMFTARGWRDFTAAVVNAPEARFAAIAMRRILDWNEMDRMLAETPKPEDEGHVPLEEPQLAFHRDSEETFDECLRYGHRNKAELIARIGVPGPWTSWKPAPWDVTAPLPAPNRGRFVHAGQVLRLPTDGQGKEEGHMRRHNRFRGVAIRSFEVDLAIALARRDPSREFSLGIRPAMGKGPDSLTASARAWLSAPDRFITSKQVTAPGGSPHDYFSVAPYWTATGEYRDGVVQAAPGSDDDPRSGRYDRTSLIQFTTRCHGLAVSGRLLGRREMLQKSAELIRKWLLDAATRLTPTARYAQMKPGSLAVSDAGLVEFRGLSLLPYAVSILAAEGQLSADEVARIRAWFSAFLEDCEKIGTYVPALQRDNNLGTWASVLFCSSALFTGRYPEALFLARSASLRLGRQLGAGSIQAAELKRTRPLHYSLFNLGAWWMMARLCGMFGIHLDRFQGVGNESLSGALSFCAANRQRFSDYAENQAHFDRWISLLGRMYDPAQAPGIIVADMYDQGIAPVVVLGNAR